MKAWVLLRGWTREARHWGSFPDLVSAAFPGVDVLTPDLPGCGVRNAERSPASIDGMVAAVRAAVGGPGPWGLAGISMGGMIAIEWARRFPSEIAAGCLVNTSAYPFAMPWERLRPRNYGTIAHLFAGSHTPLERERVVLGMTSNAHGHDEAVAAEWARYARERPVSSANAGRQLTAAARFVAPGTAPPVPWLVLCSAQDRLVDPACSRRLAHAWRVPLQEHPTAGHELMLDDAPWVAARMAEAFRPT